MSKAPAESIETGPAEVAVGLGAVRFADMGEMVEFAKMMADSGPAVKPHLRGQPGACLAIATKAMRFGFDPFSLAEHSFLANKGFGDERDEIIAYDSFVIRAIINAHAPITGALEYSYEGEGDERTCTVTATGKDGKTRSLKSPPLRELKAARTENGVLTGSSLWETKPDQQQGYDTGRDFCRLHHPDILMGWYDKDELQAVKAERPKPQVGKRLAGNNGAGFSADGVTKALAHVPAKSRTAAAIPAKAATGPRKASKRRKTKRPAKVAARAAAITPPAPPAHNFNEF